MAEHVDTAGELSQVPDTAEAGSKDAPVSPSHLGVRLPLTVGAVVVLVLGGLCGWLAYRDHQSDRIRQQNEVYLQVARQAALNLTTIGYTEAEADVQRIVDSATGAFRDEFSQRAPAFIDVVKKAQSVTKGSVTAAGVETVDDDSAQVLVAVSVETSSGGSPDKQPRAWRMRITVDKAGDTGQVSNVTFVP